MANKFDSQKDPKAWKAHEERYIESLFDRPFDKSIHQSIFPENDFMDSSST